MAAALSMAGYYVCRRSTQARSRSRFVSLARKSAPLPAVTAASRARASHSLSSASGGGEGGEDAARWLRRAQRASRLRRFRFPLPATEEQGDASERGRQATI